MQQRPQSAVAYAEHRIQDLKRLARSRVMNGENEIPPAMVGRAPAAAVTRPKSQQADS